MTAADTHRPSTVAMAHSLQPGAEQRGGGGRLGAAARRQRRGGSSSWLAEQAVRKLQGPGGASRGAAWARQGPVPHSRAGGLLVAEGVPELLHGA